MPNQTQSDNQRSGTSGTQQQQQKGRTDNAGADRNDTTQKPGGQQSHKNDNRNSSGNR